MSFTSELNNTVKYLKRIRTAVLARGGDISVTAGLDVVPDAVYDIPADASLGFVNDSSIAYQKETPQNAQPYAKLQRLGGMSYKSESVLPFPYFNMEETTINGVTFSPQPDGTVTVNGRNTNEFATAFPLITTVSADRPKIPKGTYTVTGCPKGGSSNTYWIQPAAPNITESYRDYGDGKTFTTSSFGSTQRLGCNIVIAPGFTCKNLVFKPMIIPGDVITNSFLPFGLVNVKPIGIASEGTNKINLPESVILSPEYGRGLNYEYYNYITWESVSAKFVEMVGEYAATGTEAFELRGANASGVNVFSVPGLFRYKQVSDSPSLSNKYTYGGTVGGIAAMQAREDAAGTYLLYYVDAQDAPTLYVTSSATTVEEFLAEFTGTKILYALSSIVEKDITADVPSDSFIAVQGGGTVTAENINNAAVPWTISFVTKVGN